MMRNHSRGIEDMKCDHDDCQREAVIAVREMLEKKTSRLHSGWEPGNLVWGFCAVHEDKGRSRLATEGMRVTKVSLEEGENLKRLR